MATPAGGTATESVPSIDVWSWTKDANPDLDTLLEVKNAVLVHRPLRRELEGHMAELDEDDTSNARTIGLGYWMLARYHRAYPHLAKVKGTPDAVRYALAECCLRSEVADEGERPMRRPGRAVELLAKHGGIKTDPRIYSLSVEAIAFDHDLEGIRGALTDAPKPFKGTADEVYFRGLIAEEEGDYEAAIGFYNEAVEKNPEHRLALLRLAFRADLIGDEELAEEFYSKLVSLQPPDAHSLLNYGVFLEDKGDFDGAMRCYGRVLEQFPNHRRALSYLRDARSSLDMVFDEDNERRHDKRNRLLRIPINDFELSVRARNCLAKMKIETLGDLVQRTEAELLAYKNFGDTSLQEIKQLLESKGLRLGMNLDEDPIPLHPVKAAAPERKGEIELPPGVDPSVLKVVLADLDLSVRCRKALAQVNAVTIGDLLHHSEVELMGLKNFGTTSLNELKARLGEYGVGLKPS